MSDDDDDENGDDNGDDDNGGEGSGYNIAPISAAVPSVPVLLNLTLATRYPEGMVHFIM